MGFFSKKTESPKKDGQNVQHGLGATCPICNGNNFVVQKVYHLKYDGKWGKFNNQIDASVLTGDKTGICINCGIIAFGELLFKSNNHEKSLEYYNKLMDATTKYHYIFQRILETAPPDKRKTEADNAYYEIINGLKTADPLFFIVTKPDKFILQSFKFVKENKK